ncbi:MULTISPECIES: hypothetical protein [unclassified Pseudocitrobacter]|uniref:hypothetical protein n=1 Tax=unclassified Pseudocitrobacter TaxID=2638778 RepID=UPI0023E3848D|nr:MULTISPECIES: hypothetical protein [unclassified Pseudocitrobacter]MDF3830037.1 hypothetical protein [Pseudocitrobacter sp. 2023EL-00150]MEC5375752.1 hypothetical protein [Pseudocitrobacter sp. MW920760]
MTLTANTREELDELAKNKSIDIIRNMNDLSKRMLLDSSQFSKLPDAARTKFLDEVGFSEEMMRICHFNYSILKNELNNKDFILALSEFGLSEHIFDVYQDCKCDSASGHCISNNPGYFCIGGGSYSKCS